MPALQYKPIVNAAIIALLGFFLQYLFNVSVSNLFSPAQYGDFSLTYHILYALCPLVIWGGNVGVVRFFPAYLKEQKSDGVYQYAQWLSKTFLLFSLLLLVGAGLVFYVSNHYFHTSVFIRHHHLLVYTIWLVPLLGVSTILAGTLTALKRPVLGTICYNVVKYFSLLLAIWLVMWLFKHADTLLLFWMLLVGSLIQFAIVFSLVLRSMHQVQLTWRGIWKCCPVPSAMKKEWFDFGRVITMQSMISAVTFVVMLVWLKLFGRHADELGYYSSFMVISGIIYVFNKCLSMVMESTIAYLASDKDLPLLQKRLGGVQVVSLLCNIVVGGAVMVFADFFLAHFGPTYVHLADLLRVYLFLQIMSCFCNMAFPLCQLLGYQKQVFVLNGVRFCLLIVAGGLGVCFFGLEGAVLVHGIIYFLYGLVMALVVYANKGISILPFGLWSRR